MTRSMRALLSAALTLFSLAILSGCFPVRVTASPEVTGAVTREGREIQGAEISVQEWFNGTCKITRDRTATDETGNFVIAHRRKWEMSVPGDRIANWAVCIKLDKRWFLGYAETHMGFPPRNVHLICELKAEMTQRESNSIQNCRKDEAHTRKPT